MKVNVPLDHGFLPDKYAKKAAPESQLEDHQLFLSQLIFKMRLLEPKLLH